MFCLSSANSDPDGRHSEIQTNLSLLIDLCLFLIWFIDAAVTKMKGVGSSETDKT
jgi:hypothetical protein